MADVELFSEELISEAKEIEKQDVVVDELQGKLVDLQSYLQNLTNAGVVCKNDAIALESIEQGILTSKTPINSFTTQHSKTNFALAVKQTQVSIESVAIAVGAAIAAAIVMVVAWIIKLLTKSNSDSKDDVKKSDEFKKRKEEFDRSWKKTQDDIKRQYADAKLDSERVDKLFDDALSRIRDNGGQSKVHQTAGNHTIEGAFEVVEEDNAATLKAFLTQHYSDLIKEQGTFKSIIDKLNGTLDKITGTGGIEKLIEALKLVNDGHEISHIHVQKLKASVIHTCNELTDSNDVTTDKIKNRIIRYIEFVTEKMSLTNRGTSHSAETLLSLIEENNKRLKAFNPERMDRQIKMLSEFQQYAEKLKSQNSSTTSNTEGDDNRKEILKTVKEISYIYIIILTLSVRVKNHVKTFEHGLHMLVKKEEHNAAKVVSIVRENVPKEDQPKSLDEITEQLKTGKFSL